MRAGLEPFVSKLAPSSFIGRRDGLPITPVVNPRPKTEDSDDARPEERGDAATGQILPSNTPAPNGERMRDDRISESATVTFTVKPEDSWNEMLATLRKEGMLAARRMVEDGHHFEVAGLAPHLVKGGDSVPTTGVALALDWKLVQKMEMVALARDFITTAYVCGALDPALPVVLKSVIEEKGLYEHGVGEFFLLYGKFEQKFGTQGKQTRLKMDDLVAGKTKYLKPTIDRGKQRMDPLPHAVRNILAHAGSNPNRLDQEGNDIRMSIDLLKTWIQSTP